MEKEERSKKNKPKAFFGVCVCVCFVLFLRNEKVLAMGIKRLYQEGSEITKGKNTWKIEGQGGTSRERRVKQKMIKRSADVRSCGRCPIDGTKKVVI